MHQYLKKHMDCLANYAELITVWKFFHAKVFLTIKIFCTLSLTLHNLPGTCKFIRVCALSESILQENHIEEHCLEYSLESILQCNNIEEHCLKYSLFFYY